MKNKSFMILIVFLLAVSLAIPGTSYARERYSGRQYYGRPYSGHQYSGRPYYRHHYNGHYGRHYDGWYGAGVLAGGILLGALIAQPWYYRQAPVYTAPSTVYVPNQAYAYPDPNLTSKEGSGEWVEVPGQSVNGKWVPPHKTWVPK